jgi:general secretion pathway protein A
LRILAERLIAQRAVKVGVFSRPQAGLADFYREMDDLFGVELHPHNRWAGAMMLRDRWQTHITRGLSFASPFSFSRASGKRSQSRVYQS